MFSLTRQSLVIIVCGTLLLLLSASDSQAQRLHPKVKNKAHEIQKIIVLPATVSFGKIGMKGAETKQTEAVKIEPQLARAVANEFSRKKMTVLSSPFTETSLEENKDLRTALADVQEDFDELLQLITRKEKDIEKGRFTLGDKVLLLNQDDQVDAFVFIRAMGLEPSKGMKAWSLLTLNPFGLMPISQVWVTIVDARSGEVLAHRTVVGISNLKKDDEKGFEKMFAGSFKKLADANSSAKEAKPKS